VTDLRISGFVAGHRRLSAWRTNRTLRRLRSSGHVAADLNLVGLPDLHISGTLRIGRSVTIKSDPVQTHLVAYAGGNLEIGDGVTIGSGGGIACHLSISVGPNTIIGNGVGILDSDFHVAGDATATPEYTPIKIGSGVTIGDRVLIMRGSVLEDGAIVDADSVVSGIVPAGAHVAGVPAREVKSREELRLAGSVEERVLAIAQRVFRLPQAPKVSDGPTTIARWDSLGSLTFLLALEEEFQVFLDVDDAGRVRTLADVTKLAQRMIVERKAA
jgi:acetyltransferase-like isoleucine patch superfamily enzyme/acyl carrier protein